LTCPFLHCRQQTKQTDRRASGPRNDGRFWGSGRLLPLIQSGRKKKGFSPTASFTMQLVRQGNKVQDDVQYYNNGQWCLACHVAGQSQEGVYNGGRSLDSWYQSRRRTAAAASANTVRQQRKPASQLHRLTHTFPIFPCQKTKTRPKQKMDRERDRDRR
jgi:hypothetical protein